MNDSANLDDSAEAEDPVNLRAMILAAGYGTRLYPLTLDRAKPALPFLNRPLVGYVAEYLARHDCREVAVNLHHLGDSVRHSLGDGSRFGVDLTYVEEPEILGTGGALANARAFLDRGTFVVINGKIVTDIDLGNALSTHRKRGALATLVLRRNHTRERFSTVNITADEWIIGFGAAPPKTSDNVKMGVTDSTNDADSPLMFTGIQILEPEIFRYIPPQGFSHTTTEVYPEAMRQGEHIAAHIAEGMWHEMSTIERYLDISLSLMREENLAFVCGEDCVIEANAKVEDTILWERVRVEAGASLCECIVGDDVVIERGEHYTRAAIVRASLVRGTERPAKAHEGEFRGNNFVVSLP